MTTIRTRAQVGIEAVPVTVEAHVARGPTSFSLVGLAKTAVREARDRVQSAIRNAGLQFPRGKIVVNLAPADLAKEGGRYDLAIALSLLAVSGQIKRERLTELEFLGELSLYGDVRPIRGCFCAASGLPPGMALVVPEASWGQLASLDHAQIYPVRTLADAIDIVNRPERAPPPRQKPVPAPATRADPFTHIKGQMLAKRALVVAVAGAHHVLMTGPPGTGKTMLARGAAALIPPLGEADAGVVANLYSAAGRERVDFAAAPFRDPHHNASTAAVVGGGTPVIPGEISMAHAGILFLDELPEYNRAVLEALREPLESGEIVVARASGALKFPARFQLVAAMNPCPAGLICTDATCRCSIDQARRYRARVSGPLLDRFDIRMVVGPVPESEFWAPADEVVEDRRSAVIDARARQISRQGKLNRELGAGEVEVFCRLSTDAAHRLRQAVRRLGLSARGIHRVQKVARTIADLDARDEIDKNHILEALGYRGPSDPLA